MGIVERVFFTTSSPGIHLIKVDSADLSKPVPNARFEIKAVDGSFGPEEFTTGADGTIDLSKLPANKAYVVTELECPGYVIDEPSGSSTWEPTRRPSSSLPTAKSPPSR